jgi:diguanylate cyclase (GGDEF)-like protein/PAS domain S-box-containing protein
MIRRSHARRTPATGRKRLRGRDILTPFVLVAALFSMGLVGYGQLQTSRVIEHQTKILPVTGEVGQRVATSQLFLVRALAGDETVSVQERVFQPLHSTQALIDDVLKGDATDSALVAAARDAVIREDLKRLRALVNSFTALSSSRWNNRTGSGTILTDADAQSDDLYAQIRDQLDVLSGDVEAQTEHDRALVKRLNTIVLGILLLLFVGVGVFAKRTRSQIVRRNADLETAVRARTAELAASEARTTAIVNTAVDAIITADAAGRIESINPATEQIFGYDAKELIGQSVSVLMPESDGREHEDHVHRFVESGRAQVLGMGRETVAKRKSGATFPIDISVSKAEVQDGLVFVGLIRDITERKRAEAELQAAKEAAEEAARRDPLTGLWNHNRILEHLIEELSRSDRLGTPVSVAMVDLDHFKQINDTHGHMVGDEVLREVSRRLAEVVRLYDKVGRFGGEEFVVVLPGTSQAEAEAAAERIREELARAPVDTSVGPIEVTASLGVVTRQGELANDATTLLVAADTALYSSKESGRDRVTVAFR